jgi:regulation of enolase protein 1 (concanavalin A-like superfamily)
MRVILKMHHNFPQEKANETKGVTQPVEVNPSTACRYPKKQNLVNMRTSTFAGLVLLVLLIALVLASINLLPRTVPPVPQPNVNSQILLNQTYRGTGRDYISASALVQTTDGGLALAGRIESSRAGIEGDMWLVKTDANGVPTWNQTYGGTEEDSASALVQTVDGGFALAGDTKSFSGGEGDMWLVKTDANGVSTWNQTYGGTGVRDVVSALVQTVDGGFALAGYTNSYGAGGCDMWLVKTDANGVSTWNQTYGGGEHDVAKALVQTVDGGFALAGYTDSFGAGEGDMRLVKTDANGVMTWNQTYGGKKQDSASALVQTVDGGFALAGGTKSFGGGEGDMWLVKTDANGVMTWNQTYGGTGRDYISASALVQTTDGGFAFAGRTTWNQTYGGTNCEDSASALVQTADGSFTLAGSARLPVPMSSRSRSFYAWLVKIDANGVLIWNQAFGGTGSAYASVEALIQTTDGGFALAGTIDSFGRPNRSYSDMWLVKTDANGVSTWNQSYGGTGRDSASALVQTTDGGFALAGYINSFGAGGLDMWLESELWRNRQGNCVCSRPDRRWRLCPRWIHRLIWDWWVGHVAGENGCERSANLESDLWRNRQGFCVRSRPDH